MAAPMTQNFNVGVLGHIDSGKTSIAKALSTVASTASFDKNPQSRERGITLDLGFSSFCVDAPDHMRCFEKLQFTLVDCPGHASLIKTIIGGAQIIDLMMLVVDATKGVQTQTAECLVIGQIACEKMIVVLNKIDLFPEDQRQTMIDKMCKRLLKTLENTKFKGAAIIPVAAKPGGPDAPDTGADGIEKLIEALKAHAYQPQRDATGPFVFAVDHCFSIRGQGTVMTGTVNSGSVSLNDNVEIPSLKLVKKVKSLQMFKQPVEKAIQGDRVGICVTQFDPKLLERGLVCSPGSLPTITAGIISVQKIAYYKGNVATKAKFHITMGHETVMGTVSFFGCSGNAATTGFVYTTEYNHQDFLLGQTELAASEDNTDSKPTYQYALLELERYVTCSSNSLVIGSKLDTDIHSNICRIAFHGKLLEGFTDAKYRETVLPKIKVFKNKCKEGVVERLADEYTVIGRGLFKKESNIQTFVGLKVALSTGEHGVIESGFGQSGKFKVRVPTGLQESTKSMLAVKKKGKGKVSQDTAEPEVSTEAIRIILHFKRYKFDPKKLMHQT